MLALKEHEVINFSESFNEEIDLIKTFLSTSPKRDTKTRKAFEKTYEARSFRGG